MAVTISFPSPLPECPCLEDCTRCRLYPKCIRVKPPFFRRGRERLSPAAWGRTITLSVSGPTFFTVVSRRLFWRRRLIRFRILPDRDYALLWKRSRWGRPLLEMDEL